MAKIVTISDTQNYTVTVPNGDLLIHSGDASFHGRESEIRLFGEWIRSLPHPYKVFVAGNHDRSFEHSRVRATDWLFGDNSGPGELFYLQEEELNLKISNQELKIYGAPHQPAFCNWSFNLDTPEELRQIWDKIPIGTDILITHGPPYGIGDETVRGSNVGCKELRKAIQRIKPQLNVCGHIHEGYGVRRFGNTLVANSSICTVQYQPTNKPLVFEYKNGVIRHLK